MVKNPLAMQETWIRSLGWEDPLEEGMATHSSIIAWRIPKDRGAWQAIVHGVSESDTMEQLSTVVHIYEIWKDGTDGPIFREAVEMQPYKETCGHSGANWRVAWKHMHH